MNVGSIEDWHVGKLTIVFTDVWKRTSFTVIETAETRTGCPEMDFKRTVAHVDWTKLGDLGAIMEPPHLANIHTWSTSTHGQPPHLVNLHTWSTSTPGQPPHLVNLYSLDPHLYSTATGKGSCENTLTTKYKNQLSVPRNVDLCKC